MVKLVRYGLPAAIAVAGVLFVVVGNGSIATAFGIVLLGIALLVLLVDVFARMSISSERDREGEEQARRSYSRTGRWSSRGGTRPS